MTHEQIAAALRARRQQLGWSQEALARSANTPRTQVQRCERALHRTRIDTVLKVAHALGVTFELKVSET